MKAAMDDPVDGRVRRAQESREARRAQILATALRVFSEKGFHQTSITDVVKAAGVARGTFYLYFDSKAAIFHELLDELMTHLRSNVMGVDMAPGAPPMVEQLVATVARILDTLQENRPLTRILFHVAVGVDADVDERLTGFYESLRGFIGYSLTLGQAAGVVRSEIDVEITASCALGSLKDVVQRYVVESDTDFDVDGVARAIVDYNLAGVGAQS